MTTRNKTRLGLESVVVWRGTGLNVKIMLLGFIRSSFFWIFLKSYKAAILKPQIYYSQGNTNS